MHVQYSFSSNSQMKCFRTHVEVHISSFSFVCGTRAQSLSATFSYILCTYQVAIYVTKRCYIQRDNSFSASVDSHYLG
jgi:hypothetical protein